MTQAFRKGQKVRIHKPSDVKQWPVWTDHMNQFDNTIVEITGIMNAKSGTCFYFLGARGYKFNMLWAHPVEIEEYV